MDFISFSYLGLFSLVFANRLTLGRVKTERPYVFLLIAVSALFYAWHIPSFLLILLSSAIVDYYAGLYLGQPPRMRTLADGRLVEDDTLRRRLVLLFSLSVNLGLLFYFKYIDFAIDGVRGFMRFDLVRALGIDWEVPYLHLLLPMGISFYTFASLSYTIDVYRREIEPVRGFGRFFLFICFFPHLVAGPIVRASMFLPQLDRKRRLRLRVLNAGTFLIIRGLFLKMVCANHLGTILAARWDQGYAPGADSGQLLLLTLMFACQIFCDFEGYSSIAQGTAYLLGFRLPANFDNPYLGGSFKNFWQRWHITLSQWLRDYLYIPLGGNRGSKWRTYFNLVLVMVLGGLWHGASLTFIAWGALHGGMLAIEKLLGLDRLAEGTSRWPIRIAWFAVVFAAVNVGWILFRCDTMPHAARFLQNLCACRFTGLPSGIWGACLVGIVPVALMHLRGGLVEKGWVPASGAREKAVLAGLMLYAILTCYGAGNAFIYFQF